MIVQFPLTVNIEGVPDTFDADEFSKRMRDLLRDALNGHCEQGEEGKEPYPHDPDAIIAKLFGPMALFCVVTTVLEQLESKGASEVEALRMSHTLLVGTSITVTIEPPGFTKH